MNVNHSAWPGGMIEISFCDYILREVMLCVLITHSNEYTQHTIINIKKEIPRNYSKYNNACSCGLLWLETQELYQNSRDK